ncbi:hypothetical protein ISN76_13010 [Dyella halodurans]|uniref:Holin n=1 Tax=Dyella halodurans TaxID=1920171 RepID=A0ABV9C0A1_9GAMM|nr:hypothetical protein [Dyella halodurans]
MEQSDLVRELTVAGAKASPIAGFAIAHISGWGPQDWSYVFIGMYAAAQTAYLIWKWRREAKGKSIPSLPSA